MAASKGARLGPGRRVVAGPGGLAVAGPLLGEGAGPGPRGTESSSTVGRRVLPRPGRGACSPHVHGFDDRSCGRRCLADAPAAPDLTCSEAKDGHDGGLRLPAYEDDRDGTGIIYEWLERSRSSDTDNDGVACESTPNAGGYVPNVQPVEPQGCPADAETWRGLQVCEEQPREGYDRDTFGSAYSSLEDDIIDMLPPTMKTAGGATRLYAVLLPCVRDQGGRDRGDGHRAHRGARRGARLQNRGRSAPGHRG